MECNPNLVDPSQVTEERELNQERGIVYIAVGASYVRDAERSAKSIRSIHPDLPICLFSDIPSRDPVFDIRREIANPHRRSKLDCFSQTPFRDTLYLDSDTRIVGPVSAPFGLLDRYDLAACHVENRHPVSSATARLTPESVAIGFTGFNSGVVYYRMNDVMGRFFERWASEYRKTDGKWDQPSLRKALWDMPDVKVIALPQEYNLRTLRALVFRSANESQARVLHLPWFNTNGSVQWRLWRTIRTLRFNPCNIIAMLRVFFA